MDVQELRRLKPELDLFLDRYAPLFGRDEAQDHAHRFVQGLLLGGERRSVENIAEAIEGSVVRSLQKFIGQAPWRDDAVPSVDPSLGLGRRQVANGRDPALADADIRHDRRSAKAVDQAPALDDRLEVHVRRECASPR